MIDAHIHYAASAGTERLNTIVQEAGLSALALQCIPKGGILPVEEDAFAFREQCAVPVYIFGGIDRSLYNVDSFPKNALSSHGASSLSARLDKEVTRLMNMGCTGIKMLEGKPDVRKHFHVPDFDSPVWEDYWARLEAEQIPVYMHVNDPEEFWDAENVADYVKKAGWFYDETFVNNEDQYGQVLRVLRRHPRLRILFPHFFFLSGQLDRLSGILDAFPEVRIDVTPGIELYYNLSSQGEKARNFFFTYKDRILYGTDIGARALIRQENIPLDLEECRSRIKLIRGYLETDGDYLLESDGHYVVERPPAVMHGLGLPASVLSKIYTQNFLAFIR